MNKFFINDVEIKIEDKLALNSAFNETLDTGVIIIPNSEEIAVKRLDSAKITNENNVTIKYFKVGTVVKEFETFEEPFRYKYTIELVSPTIDLQSIVLPNISITQPLDITGVAKRSIYYHLQRLVDVFAQEFTISEELKAATENIECPETQYNRKTLFEIFNDLLINVPAVVTVLENNVISLIRLDTVGSEINHKKIVNIIETKRIDEYCSEIEMNAENVVEGQANTFTALAVSPRSEDYIMTTDNAQIILDKPIYRIEKIEMFIPDKSTRIYYIPEGGTHVDIQQIDISETPIDITKYVVEESVYNTKLPYDSLTFETLVNGQVNPDLYKYKRAFLSYAQGSNVINNLAYMEKGLFGNVYPFSLAIVYAASIIDYALQIIPSGAKLVGIDDVDYSGKDEYIVKYISDPRDVLFNVTYVSQTGLRFRVKKPNTNNTNYKLVIDNQSNSYVDSQALWKVEKENVKRLGNPELKINMIFDSIDEIPSYAATYKNYVLTNSVVNVFANKVIFEGYFTKDYIRKNLYTGIKSKARFTSIAKGSEALSRQDLLILDYELTTEQPEMIFESSVMPYLLKNLGQKNNKLALYLSTISENFYSHGSFLLNNSVYKFGNNMIYSFSFKDNFNAGMQVDSIKSAKYVMAQKPYVNELGEFKTLELTFFENSNTIQETSLNKSNMLPQYTGSIGDRILERYSFLVMKDNREIYGVDIQMRFNTNDQVIIFDEFVNQFPNVNNKTNNGLLAFAILSGTLTEKDKNISGVSKTTKIIDLTTIVDDYGILKPTFAGVESKDIKCWGICNKKYDVLFACNSNAEKVYFKKGGQKLC